MTKRERAKIIEAVRLLHVEGDYHKAMTILCRVVGLKFASEEIE